MRKREIVEIACKVFGIYCAIKGIESFSMMWISILGYLGAGGRGASSLGVIYSCTTTLVNIALAYVLVVMSRFIADFLIREDKSVDIKCSADWQAPVFTLCMRVMGIWALIVGIARLAESLVTFWTSPTRQVALAYWRGGVGGIARIVLGIYLLIGGKALARIALKNFSNNHGGGDVAGDR